MIANAPEVASAAGPAPQLPTQAQAESAERDAATLKAAIERSEVECDARGALLPRNMSQMWRLAKAVVASGLAPKSFKTAEQVFIAFAYGSELGVSPMQSLQFLAVVNGKVSIYGDAMPALAMPVLESFREWFEDDQGEIDLRQPGGPRRVTQALAKGTLSAHCLAQRKGQDMPVHEFFSLEMAKVAGLYSKEGPWKSVPHRMCRWRARAWALRLVAADRFGGLLSAEEAADIETPRDPRVTNTANSLAQLTDRIEARGTHAPASQDAPAQSPEINPETGEVLPPVKF